MEIIIEHGITRASVQKRTGVKSETLRYYEARGLVNEPDRNASGYRLYYQNDLARLHFISKAKQLGFSLKEIKEFISLADNLRTPRSKLRKFAKQRLLEIREKIETLRSMESTLTGLVSQCDGKGKITGCPIVDFVSGANTNFKGE